jgi:hypothetical protein
MTYKRFFFAYLKNEKDVCKIVPDAELTILATPEEFGWTADKLRKLDWQLEFLVLREFRFRPVKLFCGTKPIAIGAVIGAELNKDKINLTYQINEVYQA